METIQKIEMLLALEAHLTTRDIVRIKNNEGEIFEGLVVSFQKGVPGQMFYNPKTNDVIDAPEVIISLKIKINNKQVVEFSFSEIKEFFSC